VKDEIMQKLLCLFVSLIFFGMTAGFTSALPGRSEQAQDRFIGAWRLVELEEPEADGKIQKADCAGMLVYTGDGHMSVQVMYRNLQAGGQGGPVQYAQGGYEASFGTYTLDEGKHTFTFHVEGAMVRSLIGKDLPRLYEFSTNRLIVKSSNPDEHWRVTWERY
jgi:hypothetical protein